MSQKTRNESIPSTIRRDLISVILKTLFTNLSRDFLTNIDWLLQSHGLIGWFIWFIIPTHIDQKQPSRKVLRKRCSEIMQQVYRRTPMPKYDFGYLPEFGKGRVDGQF